MECITYKRSGICCELCKTKYPDYIIHNNIYYNILFYKPKFQEYIIFESMRVGRDKIKNYHVVTFDDRDYINIGRATECELSLAELSVSRFHCLVHKDNGQAFLEDNTSKFGTLVLVQNKNMIINEEKPLRLQVNKTYIKFKLELPFSALILINKSSSLISLSEYIILFLILQSHIAFIVLELYPLNSHCHSHKDKLLLLNSFFRSYNVISKLPFFEYLLHSLL